MKTYFGSIIFSIIICKKIVIKETFKFVKRKKIVVDIDVDGRFWNFGNLRSDIKELPTFLVTKNVNWSLTWSTGH